PLLWTLGAIFGTALPAILDALRIQNTAKNVIAHAGKVAHTAATDQHDAVLLEVVAFARNVADDLTLVGETHLADLAKRGVRLLRRGGVDTGADAALLRILLHRRDLARGLLRIAALADQLVDCWHEALHLFSV